MFDWSQPTVQMLGRWQPWHDGHQALFKRCYAKTGQVIIQVRDTEGLADNPFSYTTVCRNIIEGLAKDGFTVGIEYEIMIVPNIVNITYGRKVGYAIEEETFDKSITDISATEIRNNLTL